MSNRSLLEFNHDYCPHNEAGEAKLGAALRVYMHGADIEYLPPGVIRKHYRHHGEPEPIATLAEALREIIVAWKAYNLKPGAIGYEVARDMAEHARAALKAAGVE